MLGLFPNNEDPFDPTRTLNVGRIVYYVLPDGHYIGHSRPAIVVRVGGSNNVVQLQVFTDSWNDGDSYSSGLVWVSSVRYGENNPDGTYPLGTWHWPSWL